MKGLLDIPNESSLTGAYSRLQAALMAKKKDRASRIKCSELAVWSQWTRFDARLGEILIDYLSRNWKRINGVNLNNQISKQPWPAILGVILEHVQFLTPRVECLKKSEKKLFDFWKKAALFGVKPANGELFFIGTQSFAGPIARAEAEHTLIWYQDWGYLSHDLMINKANRFEAKITLVSTENRFIQLKALVAKNDRFTTTDYINACEGWVTRRQAQLDISHWLASQKRFRSVKNSKARFYQPK